MYIITASILGIQVRRKLHGSGFALHNYYSVPHDEAICVKVVCSCSINSMLAQSCFNLIDLTSCLGRGHTAKSLLQNGDWVEVELVERN
jgi:hypothetical protein